MAMICSLVPTARSTKASTPLGIVTSTGSAPLAVESIRAGLEMNLRARGYHVLGTPDGGEVLDRDEPALAAHADVAPLLVGAKEEGSGLGQLSEPLAEESADVASFGLFFGARPPVGLGLEPVVRLAHVMEDLFVAAQEGKVRLRSDCVDRLLQGLEDLEG